VHPSFVRTVPSILATCCFAILVAGGCGSSPSPARGGGGGEGGEGEAGGAGGSKVPTGTGGRLADGGGSTSTGGSGTGGASTEGTGGATAPEDAGVDTAPPAGGSGGGSTGGLGPGSADDSPPLVLPGSKLIFDGKTLMGWMCDSRWSVKDGTIDGTGSGNSFCKTADDHASFRLTGKSRIVQDPSNHAGICFWGPRGGGCLQITPVSGSLWDYRGGGEVRTLPRIFDYMKWNFFELLVNAQTGSIDLAVEGHAFATYVDKKSHTKGPIGLQLHAKPNEVQYKDLALEDDPKEMKLLTVIPGK
jgi:hypothetical protein